MISLFQRRVVTILGLTSQLGFGHEPLVQSRSGSRRPRRLAERFSDSALDRDVAVQQEVRNVAEGFVNTVAAMRDG